jgi:ribonuclease HI
MYANNTVIQKERVLSYINWKPLRENFVKLNTDGACKERKRAGCGGVIRGNQGEWLRGFAKNVGNCSAFIAELWGVLEGLCLAHRMGFPNVELSVDSQAVVQVLKAGKVYSKHGMAILKKIRDMLALDWIVEISHEYREANKCADALANIGCSLDRDMVFFVECPLEIRHILLDDELGHSSPRLIVA